MHRVYLGNLTKQVNEQTLSDVFEQHGLSARNIMVKDSYAFVDCPDQDSVNKAIERLQGLRLHGLAMQVEPAFARQRNGTSRVVIHNMPPHVAENTVRDLLSAHGTVKDLSMRPQSESGSGVVMVTFAAPDQAQQAKENLNNTDFQGARLKVEYASRQAVDGQYLGNGYPQAAPIQKSVDFPLRLLIPGQSVGAIIGRSGQTIRGITQKTKARIDVLRHDSFLSAEKVVVILSAQTQNCIEACVEILKILTQETVPGVQREPELKLLAHNNLCGRLIGRQGAVIRNMMEETNAIITVSLAGNVNYHTPDRVISIKGCMESVSLAAERVYSKLKAAYEADVKNVKYGPQMYYGGNTMMMLPAMVPPSLPVQQWYASRMPYAPWMQQTMTPPVPPQHFDWSASYAQGGLLTCYVYIPKAAVGTIIGAKGSYINFLKMQTHATCHVLEKSEEASGDSDATTDVAIKITGSADALWRAQSVIFDKIKTEGFSGNEPAKLRCDIFVPKVSVGRLIGKGGQNVRHIQSVSDATIRVQGFVGNDKEAAAPQSPQESNNMEARVQIIGNICAQTIAQSLIRQLLVNAVPTQPSPHPVFTCSTAAPSSTAVTATLGPTSACINGLSDAHQAATPLSESSVPSSDAPQLSSDVTVPSVAAQSRDEMSTNAISSQLPVLSPNQNDDHK